MSAEENTGRVTNATLADKIDDVSTLAIGMDAKLDRALSDISDHEIRIRAMEKLLWKGLGAVGIGGGAFTIAVGIVVALLGN